MAELEIAALPTRAKTDPAGAVTRAKELRETFDDRGGALQFLQFLMNVASNAKDAKAYKEAFDEIFELVGDSARAKPFIKRWKATLEKLEAEAKH